MNTPTSLKHFTIALQNTGTTTGYMPGFGNDFETEALPDALPQKMNSPQRSIMVFMVNNFQGRPLQHRAIRMSARGVIA